MDDSSHIEKADSPEVRAIVQDRVAQLGETDRLRLRKRRRVRRRALFRERLTGYWGDALDALEELIATCAELGDLLGRTHGLDSDLFTTLELLRTRAVQIGWEVHQLSSAGYADGAYARWRTLHELAVVLEFIKSFGEEAAVRYLEHAHIKNRKVLREYNECHEQLGYPPIPQEELDRSEKFREGLLDRYGSEFGKEWGWAAKACGISNPSFVDLRKSAGYGHWKAHYGMANHAVHAGPHGVLFRLGHPLNSPPLPLSGPSLIGIGTPIDAAGISVMHATFSFALAFRAKRVVDCERELEITAAIQFIEYLAGQVRDYVLEASEQVDTDFGPGDRDPRRPGSARR